MMGTNQGRSVMRNFLNNLWNDESGISSVEYALLLAFVAAGIIAFLVTAVARSLSGVTDTAS